MGNFKFGYTFASYTPAASVEDSNYPASNLTAYGNPSWGYMSGSVDAINIVCDFGIAKAIGLVLLNDINFTSVTIQGNATDSWGAPSFSTVFTAAKDRRTGAYKLCAILAGFNYRFMRVVVAGQATTDGLNTFRIGNMPCAEEVFELTENPGLGYTCRASKVKPAENKFLDGGKEKIAMGEKRIWEGKFSFDPATRAEENELWDFDNIVDEVDYMVFFENDGDVSRAYLCRKDTSLQVTWHEVGVLKTNEYELTEVV